MPFQGSQNRASPFSSKQQHFDGLVFEQCKNERLKKKKAMGERENREGKGLFKISFRGRTMSLIVVFLFYFEEEAELMY